MVLLLSSLVLAFPHHDVGGDDTGSVSIAGDHWLLEHVDNTSGRADLDLELDGSNIPHISYYPPGEVRYALRGATTWLLQKVANTPFGGASVCLAVGSRGEPHLFYTLNGFKHLWLEGGYWHIENVEFRAGTIDRQCDARFDKMGRLHVAWTSQMFPASQGRVEYALKDNGSWSVQYIDGGGIGAMWISLDLDARNRPSILYYADVQREVRYASSEDDGTWHKELVETIGLIASTRREGSLAIDYTGIPHAVYVFWSSAETSGIRHAQREGGTWRFENVTDVGSQPAVSVAPDGVVKVAYEWSMIVDPATYTYDIDIRYGERLETGWKLETIFDGYQDGTKGPKVTGNPPDLPRMALDTCGNPRVAFYIHIEGWVGYAGKGNCTSNRPPTANAGGLYAAYEGSPLTFTATATDPDNDPITYRWDFDNDGMADTPWSSLPTVTNTWSDDHAGEVRVEVSDGKVTSNATAAVTILNLPPQIDSIIASVKATATLRIAGEKWHDVSAYLADGGNETLVVKLTRQPGKPQEVSFPIVIDTTKENSLRIAYTPEDDKVNGQWNGATPAWLNLTFDSGPPVEMHHTFNMKHPETWNWTVSLNSMLAGKAITFTATATDPGSDDLTFTWEWGDGSPATARTYYNDGAEPDPYPSPGGTFPFTATDEQTHAYAMAGTYDLKVRVTDDDGESASGSMTIQIGG